MMLRLALGVLTAGSLLSLQPAAQAEKSVSDADFVVTKPVINMFSHPADDSNGTSEAPYGTGVLSLEKRGEWTRIRTPDEYTGWVHAADLQAMERCGYESSEGHYVEVTALAASAFSRARCSGAERQAFIAEGSWTWFDCGMSDATIQSEQKRRIHRACNSGSFEDYFEYE